MFAKVGDNAQGSGKPGRGVVPEMRNAVTPLPNPEVCRTRDTGVPLTVECEVNMPQRCAFVQQFGGVFDCRHPDRLKFDEGLRLNKNVG